MCYTNNRTAAAPKVKFAFFVVVLFLPPFSLHLHLTISCQFLTQLTRTTGDWRCPERPLLLMKSAAANVLLEPEQKSRMAPTQGRVQRAALVAREAW